MKKIFFSLALFLAIVVSLPISAYTDVNTENAIILLHYPPNMSPALQAKAIKDARQYCYMLGFSDIDDCYRTLRTEKFQKMLKQPSTCCCNDDCSGPFMLDPVVPGACDYCG